MEQTSGGIDPDKELLRSFSSESPESEESSLGIVPVSSLDVNDIFVKSVNNPSSVGIVPLIEFNAMSSNPLNKINEEMNEGIAIYVN